MPTLRLLLKQHWFNRIFNEPMFAVIKDQHWVDWKGRASSVQGKHQTESCLESTKAEEETQIQYS